MHKHLLLAQPRERRNGIPAASSAKLHRIPPTPSRCRDVSALGIVCAPAATYRGYTITVVLDRLAVGDRWTGRATIASCRSPSRTLLALSFERLPRQRGGDRARLIVLRAALEAIDNAHRSGREVCAADA